jgi:uncharacterized membrane-anchored protein YjiN (DUF445 family)
MSPRKIANSLLISVILIYLFLLTLEESSYLPWLKAFCEAALVGALADWFAVVALFRRPLGLPFPNSAVIPRNRQRIAEELSRFIDQQFLAPRVIIKKITSSASSFINNSISREKFAHEISKIISLLLPRDGVLDQLSSTLAKGLLGEERALLLLAKGGVEALRSLEKNDQLFAECVSQASQLLNQHSSFISHTAEKPWYLPRFVYEAVYQSSIKNIEKNLGEIAINRDHPARLVLRDKLKQLADDLNHNCQFQLKAQNYVSKILDSQIVKLLAQHLSVSLHNLAGGEKLENFIKTFLERIAQAVEQDEEWLNQSIEALFQIYITLSRRYRPAVKIFLKGVVDSWDTHQLVDKFESRLAPDLQYIRINGTLLGGCLGLLLEALRQLGGVNQ